MPLLTLIFIFILLCSCIRGYQRGLVLQVTSILRLVISLVIAYQFSSDLAPALQKNIPISVPSSSVELFYRVCAFVVLLLSSRFVLSFVFGFVNQLARLPLISFVNRIGGFLFGILQSAIICFVIVHVLYILPWAAGKDAVQKSDMAQEVLNMFPSEKISSENSL